MTYQNIRNYSRSSPLAIGIGVTMCALSIFAMIFISRMNTGQDLNPHAALFTGVGVLLMLVRHGIIIDRDSARFSSWWGIFRLPIFSRNYSYGAGAWVIIKKRASLLKRGRNPRWYTYPVAIETGGNYAVVIAPKSYLKAREVGENIAKFMGVGMQDLSDGVVIREAGMLDASVREQAKKNNKVYKFPELPESSNIRMITERDKGTVEIVIKPPPPSLVANMFLSFIPSQTGQEIIKVSPNGLQVLQEGPKGTEKILMSGDKIEEVYSHDVLNETTESAMRMLGLGPGAVVVRSDERTLNLGRTLKKDELIWLRDIILYSLCFG